MWWIAAVAILLILIAYGLVDITYTKGFGRRTEDPGQPYTYYYEHYKKDHPRKTVDIPGTKAMLKGFIYGAENTKALLIFAHGIGAFHETYLSTILWFADQGYRVLAPDFTGSGSSGGKGTLGLPQSAIDMNSVLDYVENDPELSALPVVMMGHSWGSYGVGASLNWKHDVRAAVCCAGFDDPVDMASFTFNLLFGRLGRAASLLIALYSRIHFGKAGLYKASKGINRADIPVLIVQGSEDPLVTADRYSMYAHRHEITNGKVEYLYLTKKYCSSHGSMFFTDTANEALARIDQKIADLHLSASDASDSKKAELYETLDKDLMSEPNSAFLQKADAFFRKALEVGE